MTVDTLAQIAKKELERRLSRLERLEPALWALVHEVKNSRSYTAEDVAQKIKQLLETRP